MKLYQIHASANCYRVRLMLALLGLAAELVELDHHGGELESPAFRGLNPFGEVPVLADGEVRLRDSQAILVYLARRYGAAHWLPLEPGDLARIQQWLSFAANEIQNGPRLARGIVLFGRSGDLEEALRRTGRVLALLDGHLASRKWLETASPTIADVACYPYVNRIGDAGVELSRYAALGHWLRRVESLDGYVALEAGGPAPAKAKGA
jgi:glutathione S-transferase